MIDLIAFLGTTDYKPTVYWTDDFELKTKFVQIASAARIEGLSRLTILATKKARETHETGFREEWERLPRKAEWAGVELIFQTVPDGHNFEEAVGIFKEIAEKLDEYSEVYFDITHGFRSQPLIGLLALQYLEAQRKDLVIKDVSYGVYVPGEPNHPDNGRLVSLADFLTIKDWAYGTRVFRDTGSVRVLTGLAKDTHDAAARTGLRPKLKYVADSLEKWSNYVESAAVEGVVTYSNAVLERIQALREDEVGMAIGPFFAPLLDEINNLVGPLEASEATSESGLAAQLKLLEWVVDTGRYQLALVIAREWMVSLVYNEMNATGELPAEQELGEDGRRKSPRKFAEDKLNKAQKESDPRSKAWSGLADARNKFSHAWMGHDLSKNPLGEARKILDNAIHQLKVELNQARGESN